jgi:TusA-related sulfurtransferase
MPSTYAMHDGKRITMTSDQRGVSERAPEWAKQEWRVTLRHNGKRMTFPYYGGGAASNPSADDVVESLTMDASALSQDFAEWCDEFGYDVDSRQAHKTYNACRSLGKRFARMMGE